MGFISPGGLFPRTVILACFSAPSYLITPGTAAAADECRVGNARSQRIRRGAAPSVARVFYCLMHELNIIWRRRRRRGGGGKGVRRSGLDIAVTRPRGFVHEHRGADACRHVSHCAGVTCLRHTARRAGDQP